MIDFQKDQAHVVGFDRATQQTDGLVRSTEPVVNHRRIIISDQALCLHRLQSAYRIERLFGPARLRVREPSERDRLAVPPENCLAFSASAIAASKFPC